MQKLILPGFWYNDARPDGAYVASHFSEPLQRTNTDDKTGKKLLFTKIGSGPKFIGIEHHENIVYLWDGGWIDYGKGEGNHPAILLNNGLPLTVPETEGNHVTGALGWRYIDDNGEPVTSISTYNPDQSLGIKYGVKDLYQFTIRDNGNLVVGESDKRVEAIIDRRYRVDISKLINDERHECRYVNFKKEANYLSISWYYFRSPTDYVACFLWLTVDELRALITNEEPDPVPIPVGNKVMIRAFNRPYWMAPYFSHHVRYGDTPPNQHVGNAIAVIGDERNASVRNSELTRISQLNMPMIVDVGDHEPDRVHDNLIVAWLAASNDVNDLGNIVNRVRDEYYEKPIIAYLDHTDWPENVPFNLTNVWPSIQAYRAPSESLSHFRNRVEFAIKTVAAYGAEGMCLVPRFDNYNGSSTIEKIIECMPLYEQWMRDYNFVAFMPFADRRGVGISSDARLYDWAKAFHYAIPSDRPNRFDYWRPADNTVEDILINKLGQQRAAIVLEPYLRELILKKTLNEDNELPDNPIQELWEIRRKLYPDVADNQPLNSRAKAFEITKRFVWKYRHTGLGLMKARHGSDNNVDGYNCEIAAMKDGRHWDCILDSDGMGTPNWGYHEPYDEIKRLWTDPIEP